MFHCHGQFSEGGRRGQDGEFEHHPYNRRNGGFIRSAYQIFHDPRAFKLLMKRMRYVVARYGYSRNIFSWEIICPFPPNPTSTGPFALNVTPEPATLGLLALGGLALLRREW